MPKFSIYVPDDLWERVRDSHPGDSVSQLVQQGLQTLAGERNSAPPAYVERPGDVETRISAIKARLIDEARAEYRSGYAAGLDVADELPLRHLLYFGEVNFDVPRWLKAYVEGARGALIHTGEIEFPHWLQTAAKALGEMADPIGYDELSFAPSPARLRGFRDALREVSIAVEHFDADEALQQEQEGGDAVVPDQDEPE